MKIWKFGTEVNFHPGKRGLQPEIHLRPELFRWLFGVIDDPEAFGTLPANHPQPELLA